MNPADVRAVDGPTIDQLTKMEEATRVMATRYRRSPVPREDLIQEAWIELLKTIGSYDPGKGAFFSWCMRVCALTMRRAMITGCSPVSGGWHALAALRECQSVDDEGMLERGHAVPFDGPETAATRAEFDRVVRDRVCAVLGAKAVPFVFEMGEQEWTIEQVAQANGLTREHVKRVRHKVRAMLGRDKVLRTLWQEMGTR